MKYGKASRIYTEREKDPLFVKTHVIELAGLLPGNCYYFVVNGTDQSGNSAESSEYRFTTSGALKVFDTGAPSNPYPSIAGTHTGTITPNRTITVNKLYTYPCAGTGGHSESIELYDENGELIANGTWDGYQSDWHNITIHNVTGAPYVRLLKGHKYNYTIHTGSYPQIIHRKEFNATGGEITCTEFVDANGKVYHDWIPAIRLYA